MQSSRTVVGVDIAKGMDLGSTRDGGARPSVTKR